jgi:hypothetical protein
VEDQRLALHLEPALQPEVVAGKAAPSITRSFAAKDGNRLVVAPVKTYAHVTV